MNTKFMFAVLAAVLVAGIGTASNAYAWKTEYNETGQRSLNGHEVPRTDSIKAYIMGEVFQCSWFLADDDPRCDDFTWIPAEIVDWLKTTNSYLGGNLYIVNEWQ